MEDSRFPPTKFTTEQHGNDTGINISSRIESRVQKYTLGSMIELFLTRLTGNSVRKFPFPQIPLGNLYKAWIFGVKLDCSLTL